MRVIVLVLAFVAVSSAYESVTSPGIIAFVNNAGTTWKAGRNVYFDKMPTFKAQRLMGAKIDPQVRHRFPTMKYSETVIKALPDSFDSRTQWPNCIGPVLDQADCGSCWAFGAIEAVSDRFCISDLSNPQRMPSNGFVQRSALDMVACDNTLFGNNGCHGGQPSLAWDYVKKSGLVTETCYPYLKSEGGPVPTCPPDQEPCLDFIDNPKCEKQCNASSGLDWSTDKRKISSVYGLYGEDDMAAEIVANGPIESAFTVYEDFVHYKSGIYQHTTGGQLGGHAIKIIGYGVENGVKYWMVQNSWTTTWGDGGYFKIRKGTDECGIEDGGVAGAV